MMRVASPSKLEMTCTIEAPVRRVCRRGKRSHMPYADAPNYRYTTDVAVLDQMVTQGWVMKGEAQTRVFACVPVQD